MVLPILRTAWCGGGARRTSTSFQATTARLHYLCQVVQPAPTNTVCPRSHTGQLPLHCMHLGPKGRPYTPYPPENATTETINAAPIVQEPTSSVRAVPAKSRLSVLWLTQHNTQNVPLHAIVEPYQAHLRGMCHHRVTSPPSMTSARPPVIAAWTHADLSNRQTYPPGALHRTNKPWGRGEAPNAALHKQQRNGCPMQAAQAAAGWAQLPQSQARAPG